MSKSLEFVLAAVIVLSTWTASSVGAQDIQDQTAPEKTLATVGGDAITEGQVARDLAKTLGEIRLSPHQQVEGRAATLEKIINQYVVLDYLRQRELVLNDNEIRLKVEGLEAELAKVEKTLDGYLAETKQTRRELEFQIVWRSSWEAYLEKKLTDEFLESYFREHVREFDGTELRVAHLLLKPVADDQVQPLADDLIQQKADDLIQQKAELLARQLRAGELDWEIAVKDHSVAATRDTGGEIGWIRISGPMPEGFTRVAFGLEQGQTSLPVSTKFGIHIVKCLEVKAGTLGWRDAESAVKRRAGLYLFDAVAARHRGEVEVKYANGVNRE